MAAGSVLKRVYLSLGSNLGDRYAALQTAADNLQGPDLRIAKVASVYETAPVDLKAQPDFLNVAVEAEPSLFPRQLLHCIQKIEQAMGRKRTTPKGPRVIDIDILLYGSFVVDTPELQIPHPRMQNRRFVLEPLAEIAADLRHPVSRRTVRELLASAPLDLVRRTMLRVMVALLVIVGCYAQAPTPFFQKGVNFTAERGSYASPGALELLDKLKGYGVNSIALVPYGFTRLGQPD